MGEGMNVGEIAALMRRQRKIAVHRFGDIFELCDSLRSRATAGVSAYSRCEVTRAQFLEMLRGRFGRCISGRRIRTRQRGGQAP